MGTAHSLLMRQLLHQSDDQGLIVWLSSISESDKKSAPEWGPQIEAAKEQT